MSPLIKTLITNLGGVAAGAVAMASFGATHTIDIYAIYNQLNVVVADITKLIALATPFLTVGYAAYRNLPKIKLVEAANDKPTVEAARALPVTPATDALAVALKTGK